MPYALQYTIEPLAPGASMGSVTKVTPISVTSSGSPNTGEGTVTLAAGTITATVSNRNTQPVSTSISISVVDTQGKIYVPAGLALKSLATKTPPSPASFTTQLSPGANPPTLQNPPAVVLSDPPSALGPWEFVVLFQDPVTFAFGLMDPMITNV